MRIFITLAVGLLLVGCGEEAARTEVPPASTAIDQCKRAELFRECMASLPAGPQNTTTNDWAEVVEACADSARDMAWRKPDKVPAECRS